MSSNHSKASSFRSSTKFRLNDLASALPLPQSPFSLTQRHDEKEKIQKEFFGDPSTAPFDQQKSEAPPVFKTSTNENHSNPVSSSHIVGEHDNFHSEAETNQDGANRHGFLFIEEGEMRPSCSEKILVKQEMIPQIKKATRGRILNKLAVNYFRFQKNEKKVRHSIEQIRRKRVQEEQKEFSDLVEPAKSKGTWNQSMNGELLSPSNKSAEGSSPLIDKVGAPTQIKTTQNSANQPLKELQPTRKTQMKKQFPGKGFLEQVYECHRAEILTLDVIARIRGRFVKEVLESIKADKLKTNEAIEQLRDSIVPKESKSFLKTGKS